MNALLHSNRWRPSRHVLFPTDLTAQDLLPFSVACDLARGMNARLTVMHALPLGDLHHSLEYRTGIEHRLRVIQNLQPDLLISTSLVRGDSASQIIEWAQNMSPDLIVMRASRARGLVGRLVDNTSQRVLRLAPCPVVSVNSSHSGLPPHRLFVNNQSWRERDLVAIGDGPSTLQWTERNDAVR